MLPITTPCSTWPHRGFLLFQGCETTVRYNDGAQARAALNLCEGKVYVATGEHPRTRPHGESIHFTLMYSSLPSLAAGARSHMHITKTAEKESQVSKVKESGGC